MEILFDFRRVSKKQLESLVRRQSRLSVMQTQGAVEKAINSFNGIALGRSRLGTSLRVRHGFVYREQPSPSGGSDRKTPPRHERPPATRVASSRGLALRLELMALAAAQTRYRPGQQAVNGRPLTPTRTTSQDGWLDLLATPTVRSGVGKTSAGVLDMKLRQVHTALSSLREAGLVHLPRGDEPLGTYKDFEVLYEGGPRTTGPPLPYVVPSRSESVFELPAGFITNGWIHVLEDSEINLLMMVASGIGRLPNQDDMIAIPADTRLLHYGISRHAFSAAHIVLEKLGLLEVLDTGRHDDGRAVDYATQGPLLHRLRLLHEGFMEDALCTTLGMIKREVERS